MKLLTESYETQKALWPASGKHILAQFNDESIVVYQAFRPSIGHFAAKHGFFGGDFSFSRMSWIKPNFLWMMFRSGWGTKPDQEVTLAVRLKRAAFDELLARAVPKGESDVRLQWDPDHGPTGAPLERRAIQLGLRGETLRRYGRESLVGIEDISEFVREQRAHVEAGELDKLITPRERVYPKAEPEPEPESEP